VEGNASQQSHEEKLQQQAATRQSHNTGMQEATKSTRHKQPVLPVYVVRSSAIDGKGVFARRKIPAGSLIIEYQGERISWSRAQKRAEAAGMPINHTYFFTLNDGRIIDGGSEGNAAHFINHSCEPNCEPLEHMDGRIFIYSLRDIERGEELTYYYALIYEGRHTQAIKRSFPCHCGSPACTGTMLAPKVRKRKA
jgi:SET domain-containing protein